MVKAQAGVTELLSDGEGGGNELLSCFFSSVFHTFYSIDSQNMVLRERHTASIDHSFSGSPGWRSCFPTFSLLSSRKHGSKREGNDMEKGERAHADVEPWGEACGQH